MQLTVVGHRAGWPDVRSPASAYVVTSGDTRILLDCGVGATAQLQETVDVEQLTGVWISHMHPDHCYDLQVLGMVLAHKRHQRSADAEPPYPVYLPRGGTAIVQTVNELYPVSTPAYAHFNTLFTQTFQCIEYEPGDKLTIGGCVVETFPMVHAGGCSGARVTDDSGAVVAFSGDTGWCDELVALARDADVFACETSAEAPDTSAHGHLCATEAGQAATLADAKQLLLTHFFDFPQEQLDQRVTDARKTFDGPVSLARVGLTLET